MTLVGGLLLQKYIVLVSDGYAIFQKAHGETPSKTDTYSKLRVLHEGRIVLGSAGSHDLAIEAREGLGACVNEENENDFLMRFSDEVRKVNIEMPEKHAAFIMGYFLEEKPRLVLFPTSGEPADQESFAALGSGADVAVDYISGRYSPYWCLKQAVNEMIEAVYAASRVPTVNSIPMIVVMTQSGALDLSPKAVEAFHHFKARMKKDILAELFRLYENVTIGVEW